MAEAQASDEELQAILGKNELSLSTDPDSSKPYCDVKQNKIRPYIPEIFRKKVFLALHNISHPGVRATKRLISEDSFGRPCKRTFLILPVHVYTAKNLK
ncbi:retrovirus-related Pol polyprotein from transposon 412 [Trichonephila clavata]|uniref:Retrovirus-related Pol polyprotein from transposon 412 n=1 Tax=Trichonephila clavata TaxID=2740835 RepID=A0A8X6GGH0_TRICU|nr:retrovirus-related Pol polyprotein from transposon 412 [Trichonephila clavata]